MPAFRGAGKYRSGPCSPPTHRASAPREPCLPPGSSEALHSVAACVHGPIWICQVALAPTAVCACGMRAHCRPPVCAQSRSLHTSSSLFKSGGCGALDAVKAFILSASFHPGHMHMHFAGDSETRGAHGLRAPGVSCMPGRNVRMTHAQHSRTHNTRAHHRRRACGCYSLTYMLAQGFM